MCMPVIFLREQNCFATPCLSLGPPLCTQCTLHIPTVSLPGTHPDHLAQHSCLHAWYLEVVNPFFDSWVVSLSLLLLPFFRSVVFFWMYAIIIVCSLSNCITIHMQQKKKTFCTQRYCFWVDPSNKFINKSLGLTSGIVKHEAVNVYEYSMRDLEKHATSLFFLYFAANTSKFACSLYGSTMCSFRVIT